MLDREGVLTSQEPKKPADKPTARKAGIERKRTIDQPDHGPDILAEYGQCVGSVGEDARVVPCYLERPPGKIYALMTGCLRHFRPAGSDKVHVAHRRQRERRPVVSIDRKRPFKQSQ